MMVPGSSIAMHLKEAAANSAGWPILWRDLGQIGISSRACLSGSSDIHSVCLRYCTRDGWGGPSSQVGKLLSKILLLNPPKQVDIRGNNVRAPSVGRDGPP